jgi:hypothetical protein
MVGDQIPERADGEAAVARQSTQGEVRIEGNDYVDRGDGYAAL